MIANQFCRVQKQVGANLYGEPVMGKVFREPCAIVKKRLKDQATPTRADASASRGAADEFVQENRVLLLPTSQAKLGDKLMLRNYEIRITSMHERFDTSGRLDHYEVEGEVWA